MLKDWCGGLDVSSVTACMNCDDYVQGRVGSCAATSIQALQCSLASCRGVFFNCARVSTTSLASSDGCVHLQGLSEPLGALIALLIVRPFLSQTLVHLMLAFVGGIMVGLPPSLALQLLKNTCKLSCALSQACTEIIAALSSMH